MATGGVSYSEGLGSEDLCDVVCDPCQEDGELHKAVGMCVDCKDFLCQECFAAHKIARAYRKHKLLDKESMLKSQVVITKDKCTDKCSIHEDKAMEYYCINHCQLGCGVCMTLDHRSCESVTYIPHAAKDLANNEEYKQAENHLKSVVQIFSNITNDIKKKSDTLEQYCSAAVKEIQDFRKQIQETLDKIEADIIKKCITLKSKEEEKMQQIVNKFKSAQKELQSIMATAQVYENNKQNCKLYTAMMKTKDQLQLADERVKEAEEENRKVNSRIQFVANHNTLETMKHSKALGQLSIPGARVTLTLQETTMRQIKPATITKQKLTRTVVGVECIQDINVKLSGDKNTCYITGFAALSDNRVVITDYSVYDWSEGQVGNGTVKLVDVKHNKVITSIDLTSEPFDVAMVTNSQIAITVPSDNKVALVNVTATDMTIDREFCVDGACYGIDYNDGKLAVSFYNPDRVQVLTLQGSLLHTITNVNMQQPLMYPGYPYVVLGHDNTSLYVSSPGNHKVVHVKFDGSTVGIYIHNNVKLPQCLVTSTIGNIYVCGSQSNNIHQITTDGSISQVLKIEAASINKPCAIGFSKTEDRLYVGMYKKNVVKVYRVIYSTK